MNPGATPHDEQVSYASETDPVVVLLTVRDHQD